MSILRQLIPLLFLVAVLGGGYFAVTHYDLTGSIVTHADVVEQRTSELEQNVLADLRQVDAIKLDMSIFGMPEYAALQHVVITPEAVSRSRQNPFAPF